MSKRTGMKLRSESEWTIMVVLRWADTIVRWCPQLQVVAFRLIDGEIKRCRGVSGLKVIAFSIFVLYPRINESRANESTHGSPCY